MKLPIRPHEPGPVIDDLSGTYLPEDLKALREQAPRGSAVIKLPVIQWGGREYVVKYPDLMVGLFSGRPTRVEVIDITDEPRVLRYRSMYSGTHVIAEVDADFGHTYLVERPHDGDETVRAAVSGASKYLLVKLIPADQTERRAAQQEDMDRLEDATGAGGPSEYPHNL